VPFRRERVDEPDGDLDFDWVRADGAPTGTPLVILLHGSKVV
jgi:predicted alpha/beta-fold hydrolase